MSGTTADKLNYLKDTKESLRQELNNTFTDLNLTAATPFRQYPSKIRSSQYWLDAWIGGAPLSDYISDSTEVPTTLLQYRHFRTISFPNVTTSSSNNPTAFTLFNHTSADTLILEGITSCNFVISNGTNGFGSIYLPNVTDLTLGRSMFNDTEPPLDARNSKIYLSSLPSARGAKSGSVFMPIFYYLIKGYEVYVPRMSNIGVAGIDTSILHVGTDLSSVCTLSSNGLSGIKSIYVPSSLVSSYKSATNWSSYADKIYAEPGT